MNTVYFVVIGADRCNFMYVGSSHGVKIMARKEAYKGELITIYEGAVEAGEPIKRIPLFDNYERLSDGSFWYSNKKWRAINEL